MIRFDRVTKLYPGNSKPALNAVDLEIKAGEFVFLVGASGSGKSSFLRLVLKEDKPTAGDIHVLGQRLSSISSRKIPYFRRSLGVVFQDFRLLPGRTVYQNVAFTLQVIGKSRGFIQEAVPDVLQMVGLEGKAERLPHELSGGEQQRVAIARAVVNKPAILLADEPTGNLDPTTSAGIMQVLELINAGGTTVVMATHDVGIVDTMKRRVIELTGGNIIRDEIEGGYTTTISLPVISEEQQAPIASAPLAPAPLGSGAAAFAAAVAEESGQIELPSSPRTVVETAAPEPIRPVTAANPVAYPGAVPTMTGVIPVLGDYEQFLPAGPAARAVPPRSETVASASAPAPDTAESGRETEHPGEDTVPPSAVRPEVSDDQATDAPPLAPQATSVEPEAVRPASSGRRSSGAFAAFATGTQPVVAPDEYPASPPTQPIAVQPSYSLPPAAPFRPPAPSAAPAPSGTHPVADDPLAFLRRPSSQEQPAGAQESSAVQQAPVAVSEDDPLALAVRLGLRRSGAAPEPTQSQEVGPTE